MTAKWLQVSFIQQDLGRLDRFIAEHTVPHIEIYPRSWFLHMSSGISLLLQIQLPGVTVLDVIAPGMQAHIASVYSVDTLLNDSDNTAD